MQQQSTAEHAPSGLATLPSLAWGSHLGQIYNSAGDLRDTLVPYFRAGLENNERCLWVTDAPFDANDARDALRAAIPDFDQRERLGLGCRLSWAAHQRELFSGRAGTLDQLSGLRVTRAAVGRWPAAHLYVQLLSRPHGTRHVGHDL
jgi:hypothetical protein